MESSKYVLVWLVFCFLAKPVLLEDLGDDLDDLGSDDLGSDDGGGIDELEEKPLGTCPVYAPPPHAILTTNATSIGSFVEVKCSPGYLKTAGENKMVCSPTLTWSGKPVVCKAVECYPLVVQNAVADTTSRTYGTTVTFTCKKGMLAKGGDSVRRCLVTKFWSGETLVCEEPQCKSLKSPNVILNTSKRTVGTLAELLCVKGKFRRKGSTLRRCQKDLKWSGQDIVCDVLRCPPIKKVRHATAKPNSRKLGDMVVYSCKSGYVKAKRNSKSYIICLNNARWTETDFKCKKKKKNSHKKYKNRSKVVCITRYATIGVKYHYGGKRLSPGTKATFKCYYGYKAVSGNTKLTCQHDGDWSGPALKCKGGRNIAVGKPAFQSSTSPNHPGDGAHNAVDGSASRRNLPEGSCTVTSGQEKPWWAVDLLVKYPIEAVYISNIEWEPGMIENSIRKYTVSVSNRRPKTGRNGYYDAKRGETCRYDRFVLWAADFYGKRCKKVLVGRYVVISKRYKSFIALCEVDIIPSRSITVSKQAFQSSTFANYTASLAVDEDNNPKLSGNSCSMTAVQKNPWWAVDLQVKTDVESVTLFSKSDIGTMDRLANFSVSVTDVKPAGPNYVPSTTDVCYSQKEPLVPRESKPVICKQRRGRFVVVSIKGYGALSLCEVLVYSYKNLHPKSG